MLRITVEKKTGVITFRLEGKLKGEWVKELERCWIYSRDAAGLSPLLLDLRNVYFVDESGKELLRRMVSQGAALRASGLMMRSLAKEIAHRTAAVTKRQRRVKNSQV